MFELLMLFSLLGLLIWSMLASREAPAKNRFVQAERPKEKKF